jgi:molecular chaperone GrpE (heat shock protein)
MARLRRALLKQGHAQELFQERLEQQVQGLADRLDRSAGAAASSPRREQAAADQGEGAPPNPAQQRVLLELDQAVLHLQRLVRGEDSPAGRGQSDPRTVEEGLGLLQIRVRNLQRSFGLEPVPAVGLPFDDRLHQAAGVCHRSDLADGLVVEELLPGYRLRGRLLRAALVIVNRRS